jgi:putative oxidoreductase
MSIDRLTPYGLLALRVIVGGLLALHGWQKTQAPDEFAGYVRSLGVPLHETAATAAILVEICVGGLLVVGLLTRLAGATLAGHMAITWAVAHGSAPLIVDGKPGINGELAVLYLAAGLALLAVGAGAFSVDAGFARRRRLFDAVPETGARDVLTNASAR